MRDSIAQAQEPDFEGLNISLPFITWVILNKVLDFSVPPLFSFVQ